MFLMALTCVFDVDDPLPANLHVPGGQEAEGNGASGVSGHGQEFGSEGKRKQFLQTR